MVLVWSMKSDLKVLQTLGFRTDPYTCTYNIGTTVFGRSSNSNDIGRGPGGGG